MKRHQSPKQLVVFFGTAGIGTRGGWGADAVLRACCPLVVCRPRATDQRRVRVVLVDEFCTSQVSSAVDGKQPCESQLNKRSDTRPAYCKPPARQVDDRLLRPACSQQGDQPVRGLMWCPVVAPASSHRPPSARKPHSQQPHSPGPALPRPAKHSKHTKAEQAAEPPKPPRGKGKANGTAAKAKQVQQRIGESRWRPLELPELPAKGKENFELGYKRLRDCSPKVQQHQQPAGAQ
ncbi:hypothetical protein QJQ45_013021 [Haematococcus lacustris]|nr:hypothetical protein QJQ45_013021 [Haematococcus lacustris]